MVGGHRGRDRMVVRFTITKAMQSVPITTNVVRSNSAQVGCTQYNIVDFSLYNNLCVQYNRQKKCGILF